MLFFIIYYLIKCKKHNINIAFHNYKIKCTQNQTPVLSHSKMATLTLCDPGGGGGGALKAPPPSDFLPSRI